MSIDSTDIDYSEYSWIWETRSDTPSPDQIQFFSGLPLDIARLVFEKTLEFRPRPLHMLCVSHQVRNWLEPLVYRHVSLEGEQQFSKFYRTFRERRHSATKDTAFFQRHVHSLFICAQEPRSEKVASIIRDLTGLRSLACWDISWGSRAFNLVLDSVKTVSGETVFPYSHLRRISFTASVLVDRGITFAHRAFRYLTHMDIYFNPIVNWESLQHLERLTHLSLDMATDLPALPSDELPFWYSRILDACPPTVKVVIFGVIDQYNTDFDLLDSEGDYLLPSWPPPNLSPSVWEKEGWIPWLASESICHDNIDLDILHPITRLALGQIDLRAVPGTVTDKIPPNQLFRDLLVYFVWPDNKLDWDGTADWHRDCWTVAEDVIRKRQGLTYAQLISRLSS